ncbi:MAG: hypothetical protein K0R73_951 [Candidatus Midichloriaceae bacterium]|nr:hypothetical protein [Candidatus Midichloriaceae bacterium]
MCVFEVLHFLPLALIVASMVSLRGKSGVLALAVTALSVVGLIAGNHSHAEHGAFFGMVDPCFGYLVAIALSAVSGARSLLAKVNA